MNPSTRKSKGPKAYEVPKTEWAKGPWMKEPDHVEFTTKAGLRAVCHRNCVGAWCGYVGVPKKHPAFAIKDYDDLDLRVHGGLTYGDDVPPVGTKGARRGGRRWFGFDCSHCFDRSPASDAVFKKLGLGGARGGTYRTLAFVKKECESVAKQLAVMRSAIDCVMHLKKNNDNVHAAKPKRARAKISKLARTVAWMGSCSAPRRSTGDFGIDKESGKTRKAKSTKTMQVFYQQWEESERGWGVRPDGFSIHLDRAHRDAFVEKAGKDQHAFFVKNGMADSDVPDEYSRVSGEPVMVNVPSTIFSQLAKHDGNFRSYSRQIHVDAARNLKGFGPEGLKDL